MSDFDFSNPVTPLPTPKPTTPTHLRFSDAHDDDYQAAGDELRDRTDAWRPDDSELC